MKAEIKDGNLVITIPVSPPRPSKTGKSKIVATTSGFQPSTAEVDGKAVLINLTAIVKG